MFIRRSVLIRQWKKSDGNTFPVILFLRSGSHTHTRARFFLFFCFFRVINFSTTEITLIYRCQASSIIKIKIWVLGVIFGIQDFTLWVIIFFLCPIIGTGYTQHGVIYFRDIYMHIYIYLSYKFIYLFISTRIIFQKNLIPSIYVF